MRSDRKPVRRFTLGDALILIVATSIALALVRGWPQPNWCAQPTSFFPGQSQTTARTVHQYVGNAISWTIPFGMTGTFALLVARWRRPRPSWRRIARQPGMVGCGAAALALLFPWSVEIFCWILAYFCRPGSVANLPSPPFIREDIGGYHPPIGQWIHNVVLEQFPFRVSPIVCMAVTSGWIVLWTSGRWRRSSDWIDRVGRVLSIYWITTAIAIALLTELWKFLK